MMPEEKKIVRTTRPRAKEKDLQTRGEELEFRWHRAVGRHVAVNFEADADFNQYGCRPRHRVLPLFRFELLG
jgi:hypothetical protein